MTQDADHKEALDAALALLSLVTGDEWDSSKLLDQSSQLQTVAVDTLRKQGLGEADAEAFVAERWQEYAAPVAQETALAPNAGPIQPEPSPSTQVIGDLSPTANLGPNSGQVPTVADLQTRLAEYQARKGLVPETAEGPTSEEIGPSGSSG